MMNKKIIKILLTILISANIFSFTNIIKVKAETQTFGQILDELANAQNQLNKNNQSINNQQSQIKEDNATIKSIKNQIEQMGNEAVKLQEEIVKANDDIARKKEQTKALIAYYQMSQGENIYLDYVFGGESITDLVYRLSIVEQITDYNEKLVKDLESLIKKNEERKVELQKKTEAYEKKMEDLNREIANLNSSLSKLSDLSPSLAQEVKSKEELVNYYKKQGCKNRSDVIGRDCAVTLSNATFSRPTKIGYVTSFIGYRWGSLHRGIDIGSPEGRNTALYSIGNGIITNIYRDAYGALCVVIQYKTTSGQYYSAIYAHLSRYAPGIYVGKEVNSNTIIGYMGDTGYAFGVHLHLEVWPCRYLVDNQCSSFSKYVNFVSQKYRDGFRGAESVISFPKGTYQTWYTK